MVLFDAVSTVLATLAAERRCSSSWTISTPPTSRRSSCCNTWRASCSRPPSWSSPPIATGRCTVCRRCAGSSAGSRGPASTSRCAGFGEPDVARFMQMADPGAPSAASLVAAVHRTTGGNPFFLQEVVRVLRSARSTFEAVGPRGDEEAFGVPLRVRETVRRRLESLSDGLRRRAAGRGGDRAGVRPRSCWHRRARCPGRATARAARRGVAARRPRAARRAPLRVLHGIIREALCEAIPRGGARADARAASARCSSRAARTTGRAPRRAGASLR